MYLNHTYYLPVSGKTIYYKSNGTGRDSYIMRDSGGLIKARQIDTSHDPGSFHVRGFSSPKSSPKVEGKTVYYRSNGTGRDSYISVNSGGFTRGGESPDFIKSLRCHPKLRPVTPTRDSSYYSSIQWTSMTPKETQAQTMKKKVIRNMVLRLSAPKQPSQEWKNLMLSAKKPERKHVRCLSMTGSRGFKTEADVSPSKSTNEILKTEISQNESPTVISVSKHKRISSVDRYPRV